MKKVYCVIFDYEGYEENLIAIYESEKDAIEYLTIQACECKYDSVADFMYDSDYSLIEWECGTNNHRFVNLT